MSSDKQDGKSMARALGERIAADLKPPMGLPGSPRRAAGLAQQLAAYAEALEQSQAYDPNRFELREKKMCVWTATPDPVHRDTVYKTSCGDAFVFDNGGPFKNGFLHCPFCGRVVTEATDNLS